MGRPHRATITRRISLLTAWQWRILPGDPAAEQLLLELMADIHHPGSLSPARTRAPWAGTQDHFRNHKVSLPLLEGLEADDISRWPGGIFRRAFVRAYAEAVGLDPDAVSAASNSSIVRHSRRRRSTADAGSAAAQARPARPPAVCRRSRRRARPLSRHRRRPHRSPGPRVRQRRCRVAAAVAGAADCGVLRGGRAAHRHQPDGRAALAGRGRPPPRRQGIRIGRRSVSRSFFRRA